jgi:hypothetical protein
VAREVQDEENVRWSCAQAYAGLAHDGANGADDEAARVDGSDRVRVVCTPSGGSRSVELALRPGWEDDLSDDELLGAIGAEQR